MAKTSTVRYKGNLRTEAVHLRSKKVIISDAPVDNNGKGEAFSPTDLLATSLASCMITIMGIRAAKMGLNIDGTYAEIEKIMASDPRRVKEVKILVNMPKGDFSSKDRTVLERAARTCPVALTLSEEVIQDITFVWPE